MIFNVVNISIIELKIQFEFSFLLDRIRLCFKYRYAYAPFHIATLEENRMDFF